MIATRETMQAVEALVGNLVTAQLDDDERGTRFANALRSMSEDALGFLGGAVDMERTKRAHVQAAAEPAPMDAVREQDASNRGRGTGADR